MMTTLPFTRGGGPASADPPAERGVEIVDDDDGAGVAADDGAGVAADDGVEPVPPPLEVHPVSRIPREHFLDHLPARKDCPTCQQVKQRRTAARPVPPEQREVAAAWEERMSFDHSIAGQTRGVNGNTVALHVCDEWSDLRGYFPARGKTSS